LLRDVISGYPVNWISSYVSVDISGICSGKVMKVESLNENLTTAQRQILSTCDLGSEIVINVKYLYNDFGRNKLENSDMHVVMTLVPEVEAEFIGGEKQLISYLKQNSYSKLPTKNQMILKALLLNLPLMKVVIL